MYFFCILFFGSEEISSLDFFPIPLLFAVHRNFSFILLLYVQNKNYYDYLFLIHTINPTYWTSFDILITFGIQLFSLFINLFQFISQISH
jgi:hypothetical protein